MRAFVLLSVLVVLAACGVDGKPKPPAGAGVSVTGQAKAGVSGGY
ncbi:hypothetical protein [Albidovulum sp.]